MPDAPKPTLEELRAARVRLSGTMNGMHFDDAVVISGRLLDAAIAKAEREESGEFVQVRICVTVDREGNYGAVGWGPVPPEDTDDVDNRLKNEAVEIGDLTAGNFAWVTALVPIPKPVEIEGKAEDA